MQLLCSNALRKMTRPLQAKTDLASVICPLTRIFHKGRREMAESAVNARHSEKKPADIFKYFEDAFFPL